MVHDQYDGAMSTVIEQWGLDSVDAFLGTAQIFCAI